MILDFYQVKYNNEYNELNNNMSGLITITSLTVTTNAVGNVTNLVGPKPSSELIVVNGVEPGVANYCGCTFPGNGAHFMTITNNVPVADKTFTVYCIWWTPVL